MEAETQAETGTNLECELKLRIRDAAQIEALLAAVRARADLGPLEVTEQVDTYFDTASGALRRAGLGGRVRRKAGGVGILVKPVLLLPQTVLIRPEVGRKLAADEDPARALRELLASDLGLVLDVDLEPQVILSTTRRRGIVSHASFRAELCEDHVTASLPDGSRVVTFQEIELELQEGGLGALHGFVKEVSEAVGVKPTVKGKYVRARKELGLPGFDYGSKLPPLSPDSPAQDLVRAQLGRQLDLIQAHASGTAVSLDPEHCHDMRVASRRMRSGLRIFRKCLDAGQRKELGRRLKALGGTLGELRDLDVHLENARRDRDILGATEAEALVQSLKERRAPVIDTVRALIAGEAFATLMGFAREVIQTPPPNARAATAGELAARVLRSEAKRYAKQIKALPPVPKTSDLHEVRIAGKRLRYAIEFVAPVLEEKTGALINRMRRAQDELGAFQDDIALLERGDLCDEAHADAMQTVAARVEDPAGYLAAVLEHVDVKELRKALKAIARRLEQPDAATPVVDPHAPPA